ncbi:MAG: hypothetical protein J6A74_03085 [Oscillospiraceae bacterium]|nr:hypothetical protein [Oscillospiraceae bacterium]
MCNIAGYVGTKPAAPILLEMMRKQDGWDCGHYVGMATMDEGKFYLKKLIGNLDMFMEKYTAEDFSGTVGFIHGRTPGQQGQHYDAWAHPFLGTGDQLLYMANGVGGVFSKTSAPVQQQIYMQLKEEGYRFLTANADAGPKCPVMPDGMQVHATDVRCQMVQKNMNDGLSLPAAAAKANQQVPSEVVSLAMHLQEPDSITWTRINYPMHVGVADHGIYLATTPQAMPDDARSITLLPALTSGRVYKDHYEFYPFKNPEITVAPVTPSVWKACYDAMEQTLSQGEMDHDDLDRLIRPLFPEATCAPVSAVNYAIMQEFEKTGRLEIRRGSEPGTLPGSTAPKLYARLK